MNIHRPGDSIRDQTWYFDRWVGHFFNPWLNGSRFHTFSLTIPKKVSKKLRGVGIFERRPDFPKTILFCTACHGNLEEEPQPKQIHEKKIVSFRFGRLGSDFSMGRWMDETLAVCVSGFTENLDLQPRNRSGNKIFEQKLTFESSIYLRWLLISHFFPPDLCFPFWHLCCFGDSLFAFSKKGGSPTGEREGNLEGCGWMFSGFDEIHDPTWRIISFSKLITMVSKSPK